MIVVIPPAAARPSAALIVVGVVGPDVFAPVMKVCVGVDGTGNTKHPVASIVSFARGSSWPIEATFPSLIPTSITSMAVAVTTVPPRYDRVHEVAPSRVQLYSAVPRGSIPFTRMPGR